MTEETTNRIADLVTTLAHLTDTSPEDIIDALSGLAWDDELAFDIKSVLDDATVLL